MFQQTAFRFGGHGFIHFDYLFESPQFRERKKKKKKKKGSYLSKR